MMNNKNKNLTCGMDCRNCMADALLGKSNWQNLIDESFLDEAAEMMHNLLMLEDEKNEHPHSRIVLMLCPDFAPELMTVEKSEEILHREGGDTEVDFLYDDALMIRYDRSAIFEVDGCRYLLGFAEVFDIDENGSECSISPETMLNAVEYVKENVTELHMGDKVYPVIRLDGTVQ